MRQRRIKNLDEKLAAFEDIIVAEPAEMKGKWKEVFGNDNPIYLEIGSGKGKFIAGNGMAHPENNYIAIEGHESVVLRALEKVSNQELQNVHFVCEYVKDIRDFFEKGELAGIYLNFSDPWPKDRHAKRRLTHKNRLSQYCEIIADGGFVQFKTDNEGLFEFTLEQIEEGGFETIAMTRDLHNSELAEGNITTEYEEKFASTGKNINYVKIRA